jgi:hypothetical protein
LARTIVGVVVAEGRDEMSNSECRPCECVESRKFVETRSVEELPELERKRLLQEASVHGATTLAEIEARAHFVRELHGDT